MRRLRMASTAAIALALMVGCGEPVVGVDGGGGTDAGPRDSGPPVDSGPAVDSGTPVDGGDTDAGPSPSCGAPIPPLAAESISGDATFQSPVFVAQPPGSTDLYVVERGGRIRVVRDGAILPTAFLNISDQLPGAPGGDAEWGLLGLAFPPDYVTSGRFFVNFTIPGGGSPSGSPDSWTGRNVVAEGRRSAVAEVAEPTVTRILEINDFAGNHNGGMMEFGPDGFLYVATGDGGGRDDPADTGQDLGSLLGKMLRLDVSAAGSYSAPPSNPFVETAGALDEIWAYGLRNPWRFSFDSDTGDLWIGDVGQDEWEEIDFASPSASRGANYGWSPFEGTVEYRGGLAALAGPSPHHTPIYEYPHKEGISVVGGYVYRGDAIPGLQGAYLFADSYSDFVRAMRVCDGAVSLAPQSVPGVGRDADRAALVSFGQDNAGELYAVYLTGQVDRIVAAD